MLIHCDVYFRLKEHSSVENGDGTLVYDEVDVELETESLITIVRTSITQKMLRVVPEVMREYMGEDKFPSLVRKATYNRNGCYI